MPHFWPTYRDAGRLVRRHRRGALTDPSPTAVRGIDADAPFAEGHELGADLVALVPAAQIGRMLTGEQAAKLVKRFDRPKRPPDLDQRRWGGRLI